MLDQILAKLGITREELATLNAKDVPVQKLRSLTFTERNILAMNIGKALGVDTKAQNEAIVEKQDVSIVGVTGFDSIYTEHGKFFGTKPATTKSGKAQPAQVCFQLFPEVESCVMDKITYKVGTADDWQDAKAQSGKTIIGEVLATLEVRGVYNANPKEFIKSLVVVDKFGPTPFDEYMQGLFVPHMNRPKLFIIKMNKETGRCQVTSSYPAVKATKFFL